MIRQSSYIMGRLAGFSNQKQSRTIAEGPYRGRQPFVLLREASGRIAPAGPGLLARAQERLAAQPARTEPERSLLRTLALQGPEHERADEGALAALYRQQAVRLADRLGGGDLSRLDWAVAGDLRAQGHSPAVVAGALQAGSPGLAERKAGHVADYVARTVSKVFAQPAARGAPERAPPREDGPARDEGGTSGR